MSRGEYPYPADEFDAAAGSGPRGAHRAPRSTRSRILPFLLVLVVVPLIAYGLVTWLSDWDGLPGRGEDPVAEEPAEPAGTPTPGATATDPPTEPAEEPTEPAEEPQPPAAEPDPTTPVEVYNSTGRSGLAGSAAERVEDAGFTSVTAGNWTGEDQDASVVRYTGADLQPTAALVAQTLGIERVEESPDAGATIVVVLASDYDA